MATTYTHPILTFYSGTSPDYKGRTLTQILTKWSDEELEYNHDYVQLLFPLPEASSVSFSAPIVNREVFDAFRESDELRGQLLKAFERMLRFYGFKLVDGRHLQPGSVWWSGKVVVRTTATPVLNTNLRSIFKNPDSQKPKLLTYILDNGRT